MKNTVAGIVLALLAVGVINASAMESKVQINNVSFYDIHEFYASNTGTNEWQEDILGDAILASGESAAVNTDDGSGYCKFGFLAVFEDGEQAISAGNNVCELDEFHFTD